MNDPFRGTTRFYRAMEAIGLAAMTVVAFLTVLPFMVIVEWWRGDKEIR
jgi:hypothetical protein